MRILHIGIMAGYPNAWENALNKLGETVHIGMGKLSEVQRYFHQSFDLIFIQTHGMALSPAIIQKLKGFKVNWCGDVRDVTPKCYYDIGKVVDVTAFSNRRDVENMIAGGYRSEFLEIGFDPGIYHPSDMEKDTDVVFCANHFGGFPLSGLREQVAERIKKFRFRMHGIGWQEATWVDQKGEAQAYQSSKIAINCSHFDFYTSDRMWRILGSGAMCLSHHYNGIEKDFEVGKHLDTWRTLEELEEKINYYLAHEDKRMEISGHGSWFAHNSNTFDHMAGRLVKLKT